MICKCTAVVRLKLSAAMGDGYIDRLAQQKHGNISFYYTNVVPFTYCYM